MRSDTQRSPSTSGEAARAATLHRLAGAANAVPHDRTAGQPVPDTGRPVRDSGRPVPDSGPTAPPQDLNGIPWADRDPDGRRPERVSPAAPDAAAWADPPWWGRIRWAPTRTAGIVLVVLVVALGAFSVHRLLSAVPPGPPVPDLPMAVPGETVAVGASSQAEGEAGAEGQTGAAGQTGAEQASDAESAAGKGPAVGPGGDERIVVSVVGLVAHSGLVLLEPDARVADALDKAGGVLEGGDRDGLNLARKVVDGEQILVGVAPGPDGPVGPRSGIVGAESPLPGDGAAPGPGAPSDGGDLVNLNTADSAGLESLPGVGPVTAAAILSWRESNGPFTSVDQLAEVDGIGPATLAKLRPLVTV